MTRTVLITLLFATFATPAWADEGSETPEAPEAAAARLWQEGKAEEALRELDRLMLLTPNRLTLRLLRAGMRAKLAGVDEDDETATDPALARRLVAGAIDDLRAALRLGPTRRERREIQRTLKSLRRQLAVAKKLLAAAPSAKDCPTGKQVGPGTDGHCCWPGQKWSNEEERCYGLLKCAEGLVAIGDNCLASTRKCPSGQLASTETSNHCCWPGQRWDATSKGFGLGAKGCVGSPRCPEGFRAKGDNCEGDLGALWCGPGMDYVPGGTRSIGGPGSQMRILVGMHPFCMDRDLVSLAQYKQCANERKCPDAQNSVLSPNQPAKHDYGCANQRGHFPDDLFPLNCVDWYAAKAYCEHAGKRLPADEEWEWAARGGEEERPFPWGRDPPSSQLCWNGEGNDAGAGKRGGPCKLGSFPAGRSKHGINDLQGNLLQWTASPAYANSSERIFRGTGWNNGSVSSPTLKYPSPPYARASSLGFRCAKSLVDER